jgi:predicted kinase
MTELIQNDDYVVVKRIEAQDKQAPNILLMTVGLPRSGKSTWVSQQPFPIVNPDSIRLALHGQPFIGLAEGFVWAIAKVMVRALFISGHTTVILDATNTTRNRRDEWKSNSWIRKFQIFDTSEEECERRARDGDKLYLVSVIRQMAENYEPIEEDERDEV